VQIAGRISQQPTWFGDGTPRSSYLGFDVRAELD
jgi:hypothetical protein